MRILLVEDQCKLAEIMAAVLHGAGFATDHVGRLEDASAAIGSAEFDAILLDRSLPDGDGLVWLRNRRREGCLVPAIIMTGDRLETGDRVDGLNGGADDYLSKPVESEEMIARLRAVLRRPPTMLQAVLRAGNLEFDPASREIWVGREPLTLPRRETCMLEVLLRRQGRVVPKATIEDLLYGFDDEVSANAIEVSVYRLRTQLQSSGATLSIRTIRGLGYMLETAAANAGVSASLGQPGSATNARKRPVASRSNGGSPSPATEPLPGAAQSARVPTPPAPL